MFSRMLMMWGALSYSFNQKIAPLFTIIGFSLLWLINSIGLGLDYIFFPKIDSLQADRTILGHKDDSEIAQ